MKPRAYYNEFDPNKAAWLRKLIAAGVILAGEVDERSIEEVQPDDLKGFTQHHFFAGIGGWPFAFRLAGWPDERPVWSGSCPCPPFSVAGKPKICPACQGTSLVWDAGRTGFAVCADCGEAWPADARHLWPELWRLVAIRRPAALFGEQVASIEGLSWLAGLRASLEILGYAAGASDLCSAGVGGWDIRQRLYWLAHAGCGGDERRAEPGHPDGACGAAAPEARQRERGGVHAGRSGAIGGGLADPDRDGLHARPGKQGRPGSARSEHGNDADRCGGERVRMADAQGADERRGGQYSPGHGRAELSHRRHGDTGRLGDAGGTRLAGGECETLFGAGRRAERGAIGEPSGSFWAGVEILPCIDGKNRPVPLEPGLFPLAPRLSGGGCGCGARRRSGRGSAKPHRQRQLAISGAGNAINPWLAAEFIRAGMAVLS